MLLWQLKNVRNRHLLWLKLLACSLAAHLLFVAMLFFGYRDGVSSHKFTMHNHSLNRQVMVVLAPTMHKPVANNVQTKQMTLAPSITSANQNKVATRVATLKSAVAKAKADRPAVAKATPVKKAAPKAAPPKKVIAKAAPAKTIPPKIVPTKAVPTKVVEAKIEKTKTVPPKPAITAQSTEKKVEQPKELIEQKNLIAASPTVAQQIMTQSEQMILAQEQNNGPIQIEIPYTQAREFYQQEALRKELSRHWKPPHGISDTCSCEITTYVGNNGVVNDCVITQSSGILMYDVSARAAILAMELPRWTWGDSFAITFKP